MPSDVAGPTGGEGEAWRVWVYWREGGSEACCCAARDEPSGGYEGAAWADGWVGRGGGRGVGG